MFVPRSSRRLTLITAAVILGISACGSSADIASPSGGSSTATADSVSSSGAAPPAILINPGAVPTPAEASSADAAMSSESKMIAAFYTYVYGGEMTDETGAAPSWYFAPGATPTDDQIMQIANAFGVEGDVRVVPADEGGGWAVGSADHTKPSINVGADATLSWWYNAGSDQWMVATGPVACEAIDPAVPVDNSAVEPAVSADGAGGDIEATSVLVDPGCGEPTPPDNVPSAEEAEALATELFTAIGLDPSEYEIETYADEWSAGVTAYFLLDGLRTPMSFSVGYGEDGAVVWAGGFLATPERGPDYPRIGITAAVDRLNDQTNSWMYGNSGTLRTETAAAPDEASTDAPVEPPADSRSMETMPEEAISEPTMETVSVTFTGVRPSLEMLWDAENTIWLLPAYVFDSAEQGVFSIIAVEDQFIDVGDVPADLPVDEPQPDPVPDIPPQPIDPTITCAAPPASDSAATVASPSEAPASIAAPDGSTLVGLCEADAAALAKEMGFAMRVIRRDSVDLPMTMDFSETRFNVAVDGGIVTELLSIG